MSATTAELQLRPDPIGPTLNGYEGTRLVFCRMSDTSSTVRKQIGLAEQWGQNDAERKGSSDRLAGNDSGFVPFFSPEGDRR